MMTREEFVRVVGYATKFSRSTVGVVGAGAQLLNHDAEQRQQLEHATGIIQVQQERIQALCNAEPHKTNEFLASQIRKWEQICQEQRAVIEQLEQQNAALREALQLLYDCQNGCPLPKYQADWDRAMALSQQVLRQISFAAGS